MDPLYELLAPYFDKPDSPSSHLPHPSTRDPQTAGYLTRLSTLSLAELTSTEPASLLQSAQSHVRNLQALSKRSHKAVISSAASLGTLKSFLPALESQSTQLQHELPDLESAAAQFAAKYDRSTENDVLDRRKKTLLLSRNVDRVTDVLDLPTLLSSTVSSAQTASAASSSTAAASYASALDLHAHIRRLNALYPQSELVGGISKQAEVEIQNLTTILITSLQSPTLKLANAMRGIGWLRRVAPDLADDGYGEARAQPTSTKAFTASASTTAKDGALGSLFLICRLRALHSTLDALEPLRELADQESLRRKQGTSSKLRKQQVSASAPGSQSERFLKWYIEVFREQSFSIISMYKSIFPSGLPTLESDASGASDESSKKGSSTALSPPSSLCSFALYLVEMLMATLREYIPNVSDKQARESLLTQVLYCAGSLGRLGADFGMMIALLEDDIRNQIATASQDLDTKEESEWISVMKKHRIQASRLEVLARGVGTGRKVSANSDAVVVVSPG